jgi:mTERF domain-containing protein
VAKLVKRYAEVLVLDPKRKMLPIINYLLTLGVKKEDLGKVILRRPQLLGYTIPGLEPTVDYLLELGVKPEMLGKVITTSPQVFLSLGTG